MRGDRRYRVAAVASHQVLVNLGPECQLVVLALALGFVLVGDETLVSLLARFDGACVACSSLTFPDPDNAHFASTPTSIPGKWLFIGIARATRKRNDVDIWSSGPAVPHSITGGTFQDRIDTAGSVLPALVSLDVLDALCALHLLIRFSGNARKDQSRMLATSKPRGAGCRRLEHILPGMFKAIVDLDIRAYVLIVPLEDRVARALLWTVLRGPAEAELMDGALGCSAHRMRRRCGLHAPVTP